jgi:hypothetical protein
MPDCPTSQDLERLLAGELTEPSVRAHVAGCRPCQSVLETLSDDPALGQWLAGQALANLREAIRLLIK